ncbi:MAG: hypothetical protein Q8K59_02765 [Nitrosomonas sp.]|nr:hypothetical protein [Nitrosomonas sp.]
MSNVVLRRNGVSRQAAKRLLAKLDFQRCPRSLSDLSDRSEQSGKARIDWPDFEAHSHSMQRKIRVI